MQHGRFTNGGFYLHNIKGDFKGRVSAWYDKNGNPFEAEQHTQFGCVSRSVKKNGPMWKMIEKLGNRYKNIPALPPKFD